MIMTQRLGRSSVNVSSLILGTWQAGKKDWGNIDDEAICHTFDQALALGITSFDTAAMYGRGTSEKVIGKQMSQHRSRLQLLTKVSPSQLSYQQVLSACDRSLRYLNTDYIDLYQVHWPAGSFGTPKVAIEDTLSALLHLKQKGKILAIGVSNFSLDQLKDAQRYGQIDSIQSPYSLFWRHIEADILPYCAQHGITVLAYSPLAQGLLTCKFPAVPSFTTDDHRGTNILFSRRLSSVIQPAIQQFKTLATQLELSPAQLALSWILSKPDVAAIVGARHPDQIRDNSHARSVRLSESTLMTLTQISDTVMARLDDNPVMWR